MNNMNDLKPKMPKLTKKMFATHNVVPHPDHPKMGGFKRHLPSNSHVKKLHGAAFDSTSVASEEPPMSPGYDEQDTE